MVNFFYKFLSNSMYNLGYFVGKWPSYFIIVPLFLCLLCATGLQNVKYEKNFDYLYLPNEADDNLAKKHLSFFYKMNYSNNFNKDKLINESKFGKIILIAKDNGSLFREKFFWEIVLIDRIIRNLTIDFNDLQLTYDDICAKIHNQCFNKNNVLDLAYYIKEIESKKTKITYPIWENKDTNIVYFLNNQIGGLTLSDNKYVKSVRAIQLIYYLDISSKYGYQLAELWERKFISVLNSLKNQFDFLDFSQYASFTNSEEVEVNLNIISSKFFLAFSFFSILGLINCLMLDCVKSKPWIGILMSLIPFLSILSSFGLLANFGLKMITLNWIIFYTLTGINMQDVFIIIAVWRKTSTILLVRERLAETYSEAMSSITINTLMNCLFFITGFFVTNLKSIQIFCIYMSISIIIIYFVQITLFGGLMAFFGNIEKLNLNSLICVPVIAKSISENQNWIIKLFCTGGTNFLDLDNHIDNKKHFLMSFYKNYFSKIIISKWTKIIIFFVFFLHLVSIINYSRSLKNRFDKNDFFDKDSYASKFIGYEQKYFKKYKHAIQIIFNQTLDYSDSSEQHKINQLLFEIEKSKFISKKELNECWIKSYLLFLETNKISQKSIFYKTLKENFLLTNPKFKSEIIFYKNKIISSRCVFYSYILNNTEEEREMFEELNEIKRNSKLNIFFYNVNFNLFEQYSQLQTSSTNFFYLHLIVLLFIGIIFMPTFKNMIWWFFVALSMQLGLLSYLAIWKINLNIILMFTFMTLVFFNMSLVTHVFFIYSRFPLTQSFFLKTISFFIIFFPSNYSSLLTVFAKTVLLSAILELFHNLILLPIILSFTDTLIKPKNKDLNSLFYINDDLSFEKKSTKKILKKYGDLNDVQFLHNQPPFFHTEKWFDGKNLTINRCSDYQMPIALTKQPKINSFLYNYYDKNINNWESFPKDLRDSSKNHRKTSLSYLTDDQIKNDVINKFNLHWKNLSDGSSFNQLNVNSDTKNFNFTKKKIDSNEKDFGLGTLSEDSSDNSWNSSKEKIKNESWKTVLNKKFNFSTSKPNYILNISDTSLEKNQLKLKEQFHETSSNKFNQQPKNEKKKIFLLFRSKFSGKN